MKRFYVITPRDGKFHGPIFALDHESCMHYAGLCSPDILAIDIEQWRDRGANHLDKFKLDNGWILICLDVDKFLSMS